MAKKNKKAPKIKPLNNFLILFFISVFQLVTGFVSANCNDEFNFRTMLALGGLVAVEWAYTAFFYTVLHRRNFELEFIAFFLSGIGLATIGSVQTEAVKGDAFKQFVMLVAGLAVFIVLVHLLGNVDFCMKLRPFAAAGALLFLIANIGLGIVAGRTINGAGNWIQLGGVSIQPSEFVKVAFIFVGAATLEKIQTSKNIIAFIVFSVACVGSLVLIRDLGTALIFFVTFLIIAFMTSGDIKTIALAITSAVMGGVIVLNYKDYVAKRFESYRHVWDFPNDQGRQQVRVLIGIASGGLFGIGIGNGNARYNYAPISDSIFGVICEEWGFLVGMIIVLCFVGIAVSALLNSIASRSAFYSIAAVAGAGLLLFQCALNVFGITDILPLTGVTIPFVSYGGSSMISCWGVLAFIKASDVRTYSYLNSSPKKKNAPAGVRQGQRLPQQGGYNTGYTGGGYR